ncbi:DUF5753 domain-containing protein [Streptomyces halobius]|uniref:DUF5753 domain-containing protein n=1 Tax=Streptomyces halobius TaxID=2879846 RepID=A0ABY4MKC1_9ACTN|nr:DUF5753 domain-containing protein [Streptomyces halobius]UQA97792.1 DUF5753 domain-containing protein [Streptomyces halobius]
MGQASGKGWWSDYRQTLTAAHLDLAGLESASIVLHTYEPMFIPGLLQTREYAAVIHRDGYVDLSPEWQRQAVEFRMQRQELLAGERPPRLHAIIHEAALRPSLGSREVMRGQLLKLIEVSRRPEVAIQILPLDGRVGFGTGFTQFHPQVRELSTTVVSHIERDLYLEDENSMAKYRDRFAKLEVVALPPVDVAASPEARKAKDSLGLIQRLLYPLL